MDSIACTSILGYVCWIRLIYLKIDVICAGKEDREWENKNIAAGEVEDKKTRVQMPYLLSWNNATEHQKLLEILIINESFIHNMSIFYYQLL